MDDFLFVGTTQQNTEVYLSELSAETLRENGLNSDRGALHLYEEVLDAAASGIRVLATVPDIGAAYRLLDFLGVRQSTAA
jgi:hypothetical protein